MKKKEMKICFIASSGGHYEQLLMMKKLMNKYNSFIVTEKTQYTTENNMKTYYLSQINRKEKSWGIRFVYNTVKSLHILLKEKPDLIISTGVLATIPMSIVAKKIGKKLIYIESFAKVNSPTKTGKIMYKYADQFYVQWETMKKYYPEAIYLGGIY